MPTIRLPYPPSVNHYWGQRVIRRGRGYAVLVYVGEKGKAYRKAVEAAVRKRWPGITATTRNVVVTIRVVMPDRRKRDLDNTTKASLDALTSAGLWVDDSQVKELHLIHAGVKPPGWLDVELVRIEEPVKQLVLEGLR